MTNGRVIVSLCRCDGSHGHVQLFHGRAKACEIYPEEFCRKLCEAYALQLEEDTKSDRYLSNVESITDVMGLMEPLVAMEQGPVNRIREEAKEHISKVRQELDRLYGPGYAAAIRAEIATGVDHGTWSWNEPNAEDQNSALYDGSNVALETAVDSQRECSSGNGWWSKRQCRRWMKWIPVECNNVCHECHERNATCVATIP